MRSELNPYLECFLIHMVIGLFEPMKSLVKGKAQNRAEEDLYFGKEEEESDWKEDKILRLNELPSCIRYLPGPILCDA